jgi:hypothetical protein
MDLVGVALGPLGEPICWVCSRGTSTNPVSLSKAAIASKYALWPARGVPTLEVEDFLEQPEASSFSRKPEDGVEAVEYSFSNASAGITAGVVVGIEAIDLGSLCEPRASNGETDRISKTGFSRSSGMLLALAGLRIALISFFRVWTPYADSSCGWNKSNKDFVLVW